MIAKYKNLIFIALLSLLFVEILVVFPSQLETSETTLSGVSLDAGENEVPKTDISTLSGQKMAGVHLVESLQGMRDWELFAEAAEGSEGSGSWELKKVRVLFYNKEKVDFVVTGDSGKIDAKSKDFSVQGHVETKSENGYSLKTPSIFYSSKKRIIESPEQVLVQGPDEAIAGPLYLEGRKLKVLVDESKIFIEDHLVARKAEKSGKAISVTADAVELSGKSREVKFMGSVSLQFDQMTLEGPAAIFSYQGNSDKLSSISLLGGVKVKDAEKMATSDSVLMDLVEDKYTFRGSPKIFQNNDEIMGDEIVFLDGGKKVKVEKVRAKVENTDK